MCALLLPLDASAHICNAVSDKEVVATVASCTEMLDQVLKAAESRNEVCMLLHKCFGCFVLFLLFYLKGEGGGGGAVHFLLYSSCL